MAYKRKYKTAKMIKGRFNSKSAFKRRIRKITRNKGKIGKVFKTMSYFDKKGRKYIIRNGKKMYIK